MLKDKGPHVTIAVSRGTKDTLDLIKRPGQSYNGAIQDLIAFWKEMHRLGETNRVPSSIEVGQGS